MRRAGVAFALLALAGCGGGGTHTVSAASSTTAARPTTTATRPTVPRAAPRTARGPYRVAQAVLRLVDRSRTIVFPGGSRQPRTLVTIVRYPAGRAGSVARGPFPLIVFGHGFTQTPGPYSQLLDAWTRAGYVVAAPVFPLENADAPGGPNESDLVNQPQDMSFVITSVLRARRFAALVDHAEIAVAGHSDGGETALAVAYDVHVRDQRVRAAVILSGAKIPGYSGFTFPTGSPPLLATQGTADTINPPHFTLEFFRAARPAKFLLRLLGAGHLPPYTGQQPQLGVVERVTTGFLDRYLKHSLAAGHRMGVVGNVAGVAALTGEP